MAINTREDVKYRHIHVKVVIISYLSKQTEKGACVQIVVRKLRRV